MHATHDHSPADDVDGPFRGGTRKGFGLSTNVVAESPCGALEDPFSALVRDEVELIDV